MAADAGVLVMGPVPASLVGGAVGRGIGGGMAALCGMAALLSGGAPLRRMTPHWRRPPAPGPDTDPG